MFIPHYVSLVNCHLSPVTCHLSHVTCHLSHVIIFFFYIFKSKKKKKKKNPNIFDLKQKLEKFVELVGGGFVINGAYPVQFSCYPIDQSQFDHSKRKQKTKYQFSFNNSENVCCVYLGQYACQGLYITIMYLACTSL